MKKQKKTINSIKRALCSALFFTVALHATTIDKATLNELARANNAWKQLDKNFFNKVKRKYLSQKYINTPRFRRNDKLYNEQRVIYETINALYFDLKEEKGRSVDSKLLAIQIEQIERQALIFFPKMPQEMENRELAEKIVNHLISFRKLSETNPIHSETTKQLADTTKLTHKTYSIRNSNEVCQIIGSPGDIILRKALLYDGTYDYDFSDELMTWIKMNEILKLNFKPLRYRHAEFVTKAKSYGNIETISFYPFMNEEKYAKGYRTFLDIHNRDNPFPKYSNYRRHYTMYRVKGMSYKSEKRKKERALKKAKKYDKYPQLGVCSDFINWIYSNTLTSFWNFIPAVKQLVQIVYPPEGIQTPDNLADSHMTEKICDNNSAGGFWPKEIDLSKHLERLMVYSQSQNKDVADHAKLILEKLKQRGFVDDNNSATVDKLIFQKHMPSRD